MEFIPNCIELETKKRGYQLFGFVDSEDHFANAIFKTVGLKPKFQRHEMVHYEKMFAFRMCFIKKSNVNLFKACMQTLYDQMCVLDPNYDRNCMEIIKKLSE